MFNGSSRVLNGGEIYIEHMTSALQGRLLSCTVFLGLLPMQTVRGRQRNKKAERETERIYWRRLYTASLSERTNLLVTLGWRTAGFPVTHSCQKIPNTHSLTHTFSGKKVFTAQTVRRLKMHGAISQTGSNTTFTEPGFSFLTVTAPGAHQPTYHPRLIPRKWSFLHFKSSLSCFPFYLHTDGISRVFFHLEGNF